jgi:hypothetical protein
MSIEALANSALSPVILPCEHESDKSAWKKISKANEYTDISNAWQ